MLQKLKELLSEGFTVPLAKDDGKPSATFTFAYVSFIIAILAELYFIYKGDPLASTATAIVFWALAVVFFRMGKLDKFKVDLDDREIEIESDDDDDKK